MCSSPNTPTIAPYTARPGSTPARGWSWPVRPWPGWVGKAAFHLGPVYERLKGALKTSNNLGLDETTVRVLDPGRGKTRTGCMWTMVRDERAWSGADPLGVVYDYAPGRSGKHGKKLIEGSRGTVQVDGYAGHNRLARPDRPGGALTLAVCWAYVADSNMLRKGWIILPHMRTFHLSATYFSEPLMHMAPVARVCHQMLRLRLGRGNG